MLAAQTTEIRRHRMELLLGEIKSRSPNAVAVLEQQKGLASSPVPQLWVDPRK
ncbi:MAG: hypothetical protein MUE59_03720 [Thiobacillaceae bacterium]|jgi:hypothetical protein|nr:hypothetical protein [Thiobacillaceae bacterium]